MTGPAPAPGWSILPLGEVDVAHAPAGTDPNALPACGRASRIFSFLVTDYGGQRELSLSVRADDAPSAMALALRVAQGPA